MTIAILPARLANQIAAGEVVERPASVIKELIENSLDAGASTIHIDVDKGGVKRIRISDNGTGIAKDELTLALSRHATSKIKNLRDLEAINSLGFRGEALASISSVARLTLTSKPQTQATAWQANAEGRDMAVTIKPAAHPDGTTIEVLDLFFNTPARRKFLRTEKTEFNHIDEIVRRIALTHFEVTFTLTHNGKTIRQYRSATTQAQRAKRVAMVCGQKFIDQAITVDCQHDNMRFTGWLAKPSFARSQNDLCYSYVNGRMMRDKLINHAIRQAYANLLPPDTSPAFVLFLQLDHSEVDVNVHPAKHEVRFHQSRYVHDFIYSVCNEALSENALDLATLAPQISSLQSTHVQQQPKQAQYRAEDTADAVNHGNNVQYDRPDYVKPLQQVNESAYTSPSISNLQNANSPQNANTRYVDHSPNVTATAIKNYQQLMTPFISNKEGINEESVNEQNSRISDINNELLANTVSNDFFITIEQQNFAVFKHQNSLKILSLAKLEQQVQQQQVIQSWQSNEQGLVSQPLLLPVLITVSEQQSLLIKEYQTLLTEAGIIINIQNKLRIQIRQFPALLRNQDVNKSFMSIINKIAEQRAKKSGEGHIKKTIIFAIATILVNHKRYNSDQAQRLWQSANSTLSGEYIESLLLNSITIDLTPEIKQLSN